MDAAFVEHVFRDFMKIDNHRLGVVVDVLNVFTRFHKMGVDINRKPDTDLPTKNVNTEK